MLVKKQNSSIMEDIRRKNKKPICIKQKISSTLLDMIASFLVSENRNIRRKHYSNIQKMMDLLQKNQYMEEDSKSRIAYIQSGLDARLRYNLIDKLQVLDYINGNSAEITRWNMSIHELSNDEVIYVNKTVNELIDGAEFCHEIEEFEGLSKEYDIVDVSHRKDVVDKWKNLVAHSYNQIRMNKVESTDEEFFSLSQGFDDYAREVHAELSNPSSKLATGMTGFNYMLNGGFENGRTYCFLGLPGEGKSTTLLNLAKQIKDFNPHFKTKDPTKRPAIVYLTLENSKKETFSRLFSISTRNDDFEKLDIEKALRLAKTDGKLVVTENSPIDIIIKYKPDRSVDTSYLFEIYEDLSEQGYEVITFIVDYLGRIKSIEKFSRSEIRLEYGAIVNEFKTIATELDIPIITAAQLNREALGKIDEARNNNTAVNTVNLLTRNNVSESKMIIDNVDASFFITPEWINKGQDKYLGISIAKTRYRANLAPLNGSRVMHQPYYESAGITIVTDVGQIAAFKLDLREMDNQQMNTGPIVDKNTKIPDNSTRCGRVINMATEKRSSIFSDRNDKHHESLKSALKEMAKEVSARDSQSDKKDAEIKSSKQTIDSKYTKGKIGNMTVYYDETGKQLDYNPYWQSEPRYIEVNGKKIINIDSLTPEEQIEKRRQAGLLVNQPEVSIINTQQEECISRYSDEYTRLYDPATTKEERMISDYRLKFGLPFTEQDLPNIKNHIEDCKNGYANYDVYSIRIKPFRPVPIKPLDIKGMIRERRLKAKS